MIRARAFTVVEFVVAAVLILLVLGSSALALESVNRAIRKNGIQDANTTFAHSILDRARLYGCGSATGVPSRNADEATLAARCQGVFTDTDPRPATPAQPRPASSTNLPAAFSGPVNFRDTSDDTYTYSLSTRWETLKGGTCPVPGDSSPRLVRYTLTSSWPDVTAPSGTYRAPVVTTTEPAPASFHRGARWVAVQGAPLDDRSPGAAATMSVVTPAAPANPVTLAKTMTNDARSGGASSCAWFPGLDARVTSIQVTLGSRSALVNPASCTVTSGTLSAVRPVYDAAGCVVS